MTEPSVRRPTHEPIQQARHGGVARCQVTDGSARSVDRAGARRTPLLAIWVILGLVAGFGGFAASVPAVSAGTHAGATPFLPDLNRSHPPSVNLSGANGSLSITASLFENETPSVFQVQATVGWTGGGPGDTLIVGFASQTGTSSNRTVNGSSGTARFFFNLTETEVDAFSATLYNVTNGTYVSVGAQVTTVVPNSPLSLTFNANNVSVSGVETTQFGWVMFGAVPPYRVTLSYGDGTWATFTNQSPGYAGCQCGGNVTDHTYSNVNTTTTYWATATLHDSSGLNLTRSIPVQPSYNVRTGSTGGRGYPITFSANATNGSATIYVRGTEMAGANSSCACLLALTVNVSLRSASNGTDRVVFAFGDGQSANQTGAGQWFRAGTSHDYTSPGNLQLVVTGQDGAGRVLTTSTSIVVPRPSGNGSGGNGTGPQPWRTFQLRASNGSFGFDVFGSEFLFNSTNASGAVGYSVLLNASVGIFGGAAPYALSIQSGDGSYWGMNVTGGVAVVTHLYTYGGNYSFVVQATDANGSQVRGSSQIVVPFGSSPGGNGSTYPSSVQVVVDATPVTGPAPLSVTYSALISGGSAPFSVQWSLPGGNLSSNATGLAATQNYSTPGWYPATAFVYNTTSSFGRVLVGYGSVWVDVTGTGGNGSGNGTGHHPVVPPSEGGSRVGGGGTPASMTYGLLPVLVVGAAVGIVAGYALGNRRRPHPPLASPRSGLTGIGPHLERSRHLRRSAWRQAAMMRPRLATSAVVARVTVLAVAAAVLVTLSGLGSASLSARPGTGPAPGRLPEARVLVQPNGPPTLTLTPSPSVGSPPLAVTATVDASGGASPYTVEVCFGTVDHTSPTVPCGTTMSGWTGAAPLNFTHVYPGPGNFSVIALLRDSGGAGAGATALIHVTTAEALTAAATEAGSSGTAPFAVVFNDTVSGGTPPIAIQWVFGDGSFASGLPDTAVTHVYREAGRFDPSFVVTDGAGHRTVQSLPTVSVDGGGASTPLGTLPGDSWWWTAGAALSVGLFLAVLAVRVAQNRRWRREGNELVEEAIRGDPPSGLRPPPS